jgi:hypothetical protein
VGMKSLPRTGEGRGLPPLDRLDRKPRSHMNLFTCPVSLHFYQGREKPCTTGST